MPDRGLSRARRFVRAAGLLLAAVCAIAAVLLVVLAKSQKMWMLAFILMLWAIALGYFVTADPRRHDREDGYGLTGGELEMVDSYRENYELQLQAMLRREMERILKTELESMRKQFTQEFQVLREEVSDLSGDMNGLSGSITGLRGEMNEKFDGQLRLERIETTRVIGSDIQSLHEEVRRLAVGREMAIGAKPGSGSATQDDDRTAIDLQPVTASTPVPTQQASAAPTPTPLKPVPASAVNTGSRVEPAKPDRKNDLGATVVLGAPLTAQVNTSATAAPSPTAAASSQAQPVPSSQAEPATSGAEDPFADLPRIGVFANKDLAPETDPPGHVSHRAPADAPPAVDKTIRPQGGRRRRADGEENEVLRRILGHS